jgi:hypothetical protein
MNVVYLARDTRSPALAVVDAMATEIQLADILGDRGTIQDFLNAAGLDVGADLPRHSGLCEIIEEMSPAVRREWRRMLVGEGC